jgi:hypothetical protein
MAILSSGPFPALVVPNALSASRKENLRASHRVSMFPNSSYPHEPDSRRGHGEWLRMVSTITHLCVRRGLRSIIPRETRSIAMWYVPGPY